MVTGTDYRQGGPVFHSETRVRPAHIEEKKGGVVLQST